MNHDEEKVKAEEFFENCLNILVSKAHDYAKVNDVFSNFKKISETTGVDVMKVFLMFITVKLARLVELCDKPAKNESIEDTLKDLANYACLLSLYIKECHDMGSISVSMSGVTQSTGRAGYFGSNQ